MEKTFKDMNPILKAIAIIFLCIASVAGLVIVTPIVLATCAIVIGGVALLLFSAVATILTVAVPVVFTVCVLVALYMVVAFVMYILTFGHVNLVKKYEGNGGSLKVTIENTNKDEDDDDDDDDENDDGTDPVGDDGKDD